MWNSTQLKTIYLKFESYEINNYSIKNSLIDESRIPENLEKTKKKSCKKIY